MYLEHISVVHFVWGDISRIVALEEPHCSPSGDRQVALSEISSRHGAPSASSTAKSSPDRCCSRSGLLCPPPTLAAEREGTRKPPILLYTSWQAYSANQKGIHQKSNSKSPSQWDTTDVGNIVLALYLAPLRDVQSPIKGQGERMSGWEVGLQCWNNNCTAQELF